jgi:hypothetical protein
MATGIARDIAIMNIDKKYRAQEAHFDTVSVAYTENNKLIVSANVKQRREMVIICFDLAHGQNVKSRLMHVFTELS